jgi:aspartate/methionine/tyrosine aminotransferase
MDEHELTAKHNISETCCASISVDQLAALSEKKDAQVLDLSRKLVYGAIPGSEALRGNLARLYSSKVGSPLPAENILITPGAIAANYLVFYSFVGPGDHVICHYPTYQQLYAVPTSLGAEVDLWKARPEKQWIPDIEELKSLIKPNTKMIVLK